MTIYIHGDQEHTVSKYYLSKIVTLQKFQTM